MTRAIQKNISSRCKLCVLNQAYDLALNHAARWGYSVMEITWTVERLHGGPGHWAILFHDRQDLGQLPVRHGH